MKDPSTIKRALNICLQGTRCESCPYKGEGCTEALAADAVSYIWELEGRVNER